MYGIHLDTARLVANAHKHNIAVHYWTINDKELMRHLVDIDADGIMTDYPHRLKEVYNSYAK
jgi:glycerophosphoryl diester phosphodiesterase